jgi:hypothetical protein
MLDGGSLVGNESAKVLSSAFSRTSTSSFLFTGRPSGSRLLPGCSSSLWAGVKDVERSLANVRERTKARMTATGCQQKAESHTNSKACQERFHKNLFGQSGHYSDVHDGAEVDTAKWARYKGTLAPRHPERNRRHMQALAKRRAARKQRNAS